MPSSSTSCITPSFAGTFETSCKTAVFSSKQKKSIIPVHFPHILLSTGTSKASVSFLAHNNPSCSEYAYGNQVNKSLSHNENARKKKTQPFPSLWHVLFCLHQPPFPKILPCSLAPLQAKWLYRLEVLDSISVSAHPEQWWKTELSTEDLFSLWSVSEHSPWVTWSDDSNASVNNTQTAHFHAVAYSHCRGLVCTGHNWNVGWSPRYRPAKKSLGMRNILSLWISCWKCTSTINQILNLQLLDLVGTLVGTSHIATSAFLLPPPLTPEAHSVLEDNDLASVIHTSMTLQPDYSGTTCLALKSLTNVYVI